MVSLVCTDFDGLYLCCDVNCDQMTAKNAAKEFYFYKPKPPPNGKTWRCGQGGQGKVGCEAEDTKEVGNQEVN